MASNWRIIVYTCAIVWASGSALWEFAHMRMVETLVWTAFLAWVCAGAAKQRREAPAMSENYDWAERSSRIITRSRVRLEGRLCLWAGVAGELVAVAGVMRWVFYGSPWWLSALTVFVLVGGVVNIGNGVFILRYVEAKVDERMAQRAVERHPKSDT